MYIFVTVVKNDINLPFRIFYDVKLADVTCFLKPAGGDCDAQTCRKDEHDGYYHERVFDGTVLLDKHRIAYPRAHAQPRDRAAQIESAHYVQFGQDYRRRAVGD